MLHRSPLLPATRLTGVSSYHEGYQLLTGDRALREAAKELNVEVHGTIWLVEQMLQDKKITAEVARVAFQKMKHSGSRLPWDKVEKMLNRK